MHNLCHFEYSEATPKSTIIREANAYVQAQTFEEGGSGIDGIRFLSPICESREEAEAYLKANDTHWYDQLAVHFKKYPRVERDATKKISELQKRLSAGNARLEKIVDESRVQNRTSAMIGCPKCKSSLSRTYLRGQICPLCHADLRSKTNLDRIKAAEANVADLQRQIKAETTAEAQKKKPAIYWLVKIEYHT